MMFERFTAHFNQPISTTTRFAAAQQFAQGAGNVLKFTRPKNQLVPKYIDARAFSSFPNEDERLFYGKHILFRINDIRQAQHVTTSNEQYIKTMSVFQNFD